MTTTPLKASDRKKACHLMHAALAELRKGDKTTARNYLGEAFIIVCPDNEGTLEEQREDEERGGVSV